MKALLVTTFFATCGVCRVAQAKVYVPLGTLGRTAVSTASIFLPTKSADRPSLPGMRPVEVELMEHAPQRLKSRTVGNDQNAAIKSIIRKRDATYVSLGAGVAMAVGSNLWNYWQTGSFNKPEIVGMAHDGSVFAAERAASYALAQFGTTALRRRMLGKLIPLGFDAGFSIYENGGAQTLQTASFYTHLSGEIGGLTFRWLVGVPLAVLCTSVVAELPAPFYLAAPEVSFFVVNVTEVAGNDLFEWATGKILETVNPDFLHVADEKALIHNAHEHVEAAIALIQRENVSF